MRKKWHEETLKVETFAHFLSASPLTETHTHKHTPAVLQLSQHLPGLSSEAEPMLLETYTHIQTHTNIITHFAKRKVVFINRRWFN